MEAQDFEVADDDDFEVESQLKINKRYDDDYDLYITFFLTLPHHSYFSWIVGAVYEYTSRTQTRTN